MSDELDTFGTSDTPLATASTDYSSLHPALVAADTANMQAGAPDSIIDRASNFTSAALLSGFSSIYNTAADLIGEEKFDVAKWLEENDQNLGAYYNENKNSTDAAGFIATSLIPGGIAVKGLQLAKAGTALGAFGRALGYAQSRQQFWLERGLKELAVEGGTVFNLINKNKLATTAWAVADQSITVAAFETAVAATMKQSPLLEKDEWSDVAGHILKTSLAFGAIGGGIEAIAMGSIFKGATKSIDSAMREYDTIRYVQGDLAEGDRAYGILSSMLELPQVGKNIEFTYNLAGKENRLELPTKEALERASVATERRARDDFKIAMNKVASSDPDLGQAFSFFVLTKMDSMKAAGAGKEEVTEFLQDHLLGVSRISRITEDATRGSEGLFYVAEKVAPEKLAEVTDFNSFLGTLLSRTPTGADTSRYPYELIGNGNDVKVALVGLTSTAPEGSTFSRYLSADEAFTAGNDAVILSNGTIRINPKSKNFVKRNDPLLSPTSYFNTRTGAFTDVAFPTVADIATSAKPLAVTGPGMIVGGGKFWRQKELEDFTLGMHDSVTASARYAWAGQIKAVPKAVMDTDIPLLERIFQDGAANYPEVVLKNVDGTDRTISSISDFGAFLKDTKLRILQDYFTNATEDLTLLAGKLNVEPNWIMNAVTSNFNATPALSDGFSLALSDALKPSNMQLNWQFAKNYNLPKGTTAVVGGKTVKAPTDSDQFIQTLPDAAGNVVYGQLGWAYRVKVANDGRDAAFSAVMGPTVAARFVELSPEVATKIAGQEGAGSSLLKFSNADYGNPLELWSQYTGQLVNLLAKDAANGTLGELHPLMIAIRDNPKAAGELGVLTTALRRNPDKFVISIEDGHTLLNKEAAKFDKNLGGFVPDTAKATEFERIGRRAAYQIESDEVVDFLGTSVLANARRVEKMKVLMTSRGFNYNYDPATVYVPPVDTGRYPYFAFVRKNTEMFGGSSEVSMITARSEEELRGLTAKVPEEYEIIFKQNTEKYHKARGDYEYALTLKEPTIDSTLQRRGILGDFFPETRAENVLDDYISWHSKMETSLVRRSVETKYAQVFEEVRALGKQFEEIGGSKFGGILKKFKSQITNPFEDYLKTALDISKRSEYTLLHEANEFAEALGKSAYRIFGANQQKAMEGSITWQEANALSEKYGIAGPYRDTETYFKANAPEERNIVREFVSKANMLLVNSNLRLDLANSLVNIISTPILLGTEMSSIRTLIANDKDLVGKLVELRSIPVPGNPEGLAIPSTMNLLVNSVKNFWGPDKEALLQRYKDVGAVRDMLSQYHQMVDWLSYKPYQKVSELAARGNKAVEIGAKISGNEWAEQFTRFVSADVMRQLTDPIVTAGKLTKAEQDAYISVFVNRVQGNYLNSQRPIAFQGVLGSAVSLFQTYQFNMLQQLFRHIENRDTRTLATLAGLQGGIYGLNGIPFFEAINTHLIGNSNLNPEHRDLYSTAPQVMGKQLGDWMMYGTASAFPLFDSKAPSLYTRGDINPRHISILPISPLDIPAVDGSIRFVTNLVSMGKNLVKGADFGSTLLEGLEHNSLNRPLAGIAQTLQGYTTTSKGSLISASNDLFSIATMSRIIGAKPMDESLALNSLFRLNAYQAADEARISDLGEAVKTKLRAGKSPSLEELNNFQLQYTKAGGRIENYSKMMQRWSKDANVSVVNKMVQQHRTPYSQRMMEIMGGTTIQDYRTLGRSQFQAAVGSVSGESISGTQPSEIQDDETVQ